MTQATSQDIVRSFDLLVCNKCRRSSVPINEGGLCARCDLEVSAAVATNLSAKEAAKRFGVGAEAVRKLRRRFGLSGRRFKRWTLAEHDALVHMRSESLDWLAISRALDRTVAQCRTRFYNARRGDIVPVSKNRP